MGCSNKELVSRLTALLAVAAVTATHDLPAQDSSHTSVGCYFDTASFVRPASVAIGLAPGWRVATLNAEKPVPQFYLLVAQVIREHYLAPKTIGLPLWARTGMIRTDTLATVGHGFDGTVYFRLDDTGQLADDSIWATTDSPEMNASILGAIRRADSAKAFPPPDGDVRRDHGRIVLRTVNFDHARGPVVGLVRLSVPILDVDRAARFLNHPRIHFPAYESETGPGDDITLQFVVNESGSVDPGSVRILQGEYRDFARAALSGLAGAKFAPAQVAGCELPQLLQVQFRFRVSQF